MDLLDPFLLSTTGNRWIIVPTDYLTCYAETKLLAYGAATLLAKVFMELRRSLRAKASFVALLLK